MIFQNCFSFYDYETFHYSERTNLAAYRTNVPEDFVDASSINAVQNPPIDALEGSHIPYWGKGNNVVS